MSGYFTDEDDLTKLINDARSCDTKQNSTFEDAKAILDGFAAKTDEGAWASLSRAEVARRLEELITPPEDDAWKPATGPRSLQQGGMNLCGPTALFQTALGRDPVAVMQFATTLFDQGAATMGSLVISPDKNLLAADYGALSRKGDTASQARLFNADG